MLSNKIPLTKLIGPAFYDIHHDIKNNKYTHYWMKGGRGSLKCSFVSIEIVKGLMEDGEQGNITHGLVYRKVGQTLATSVIPQIEWAINALGVAHLWNIPKRDRVFTFLPTGQTIRFEGTDDPMKQKGTKVSKGYFKYIWYEEVDQFNGIEEIRTINQSIIRGSDTDVSVFYTYNPPESMQSWVNSEVNIPQDNKKVHHTTYLSAPKEWLGELFLIEAETLRKTNPKKYLHEYMGAVTGTGGEVFTNLEVRKITDDEVNMFDRIYMGIDFGYSIDPAAYIKLHYDKKKNIIYLLDEIYKVNLSNRDFASELYKKEVGRELITADSAEPKSIDELKSYGLRVDGAKKGPDSVKFGMKFLEDMTKIVIDPERTPNALKEFETYELDKDKNGNFKAGYPDKNNHIIDACRYALESEMRKKRFEWG